MRLVIFRHEGNVRIGSVVGDKVIDLHNAYKTMLQKQGKIRAKQIAEAFVPVDMVEFLEGGEESMELAKKAVDEVTNIENMNTELKVIHQQSEVRIEAPILTPGKIVCVGHNYREHILEMGRDIPKIPVVFAKYSNTIIANGDPIPKPIQSDELDYEAEFAFVIGKKARNIQEDQALEYVAGYTIANDVSVRDYQKMTLEWLKGKTFDGTLPIGPYLLTADEVTNPHSLDIKLQVNGEERQHSNTKNLVFNVPFLVSFLSGIMTLQPGDVILTGTPGGVGAARDPQVFLRQGDKVRVEIEGLGVLENSVVSRTKQEEILV
jgi:acylpyruvate hydrolase